MKLRHLLLEKEAMTNIDHILKCRDITLPTKVHLVKAMVFLVVIVWMWELDYKESWAPKNWCFWIVVLEETLESPLDCKEIQPLHSKGNQSWIFIGSWSSNTLAIWCKEPTHWKRPWRWDRLRAERKKRWQRMRWSDGITNSMDMNLSKLQDTVDDRGAWPAIVYEVKKRWTWLGDWTTALWQTLV